ncbi:hypothetical protein HF519_29855, partial [Pseudonocardia bannensis]|nr:hypothetical protein [Pseudonocardia bannensis]
MSALADEPRDPGILQSALGGVLRDAGVLAAALVDIDSGMALETYASGHWRVDPEVVAAGQADIVRATVDTMRSSLPVGPPTEVVVNHRDHLYHVLQTVPDPCGDRLALALVVSGPARSLRRVRRRLRRVDPAALVPPRPVAVQRREGPLIPDRSAAPARATAAAPPTGPRDGALVTASLGGGPGAGWPAGPTRWVGDPALVVSPTGPTAAGAPPAQRIGTSVSGQPASLPAVGPQGRSAADGHLLRRPAHPAQDAGAVSEGIGPVSAPQAGAPAPPTAAPRTTTTAPDSTGPAHRVVGTAPQPAVGTSPGDSAGAPRSGVPAPHVGPTAPRIGEFTAHAAAPASAASVQRPAG